MRASPTAPTRSARRSAPFFLAAALFGCSGAAGETPSSARPAELAPVARVAEPPSSSPVAPASSDPPAGAAREVRVTAPACGYGGSATAVAVFLDVETDVPLTGLTGSLVASDPATGALVGRSRAPAMLLVSPVARGLRDFSTSGTTPFGGELEAGARTRLLFFSGLEGEASGVGSLAITMTLTASDGRRFEATCTTEGMWPSS